MPERSELAQVASFAAFPTALLTLPTALLLVLLGFLRWPLPLWFLRLALRLSCLLLALRRPLLLLRLRLGLSRLLLALRRPLLLLRLRLCLSRLLLALHRLLLWPLHLGLGRWCLLRMLCRFLLWPLHLRLDLSRLLLALRRALLWLLRLRLRCRATLRGRRRGGGPPHLSTALLLRLGAWDRCSTQRCLVVLPNYGIVWLVTVVLALQCPLLLRGRISIA